MDKIEVEKQQPSTLITEINSIVEKIIASKGWNEVYGRIRAQERFPPIIVYKMLYKSNGNEEKLKEKIAHRKAKLQKKLRKHGLEDQFNELLKIVDICHPKMALRVLKRNGGNVAQTAQKIQAFTSIGSHKQEVMDIFRITYPNYEKIIEDLLTSGHIFPIPFFLKLMYMFQGDLAKMKEYLNQQNKKSLKKIMKQQLKGKCMMQSYNEKKNKKRCGGKFHRSPSSSSQSSDSDYDNEKLTKFAKGNAFLIENGFKNAKENLRVLKQFKCDSHAALNQLIKESLLKDSSKKRRGHNTKKHNRRGKRNDRSSSSSSSSSSSRSRSRSQRRDRSSDSSSSNSLSRSRSPNHSKSKSKSRSESRKHKHHSRHHHGHHHHGHNHHHHPHPHHGPHHFPHPHHMGKFDQIPDLKDWEKSQRKSPNRNCMQGPPPPPPFHGMYPPHPGHHHPGHGHGFPHHPLGPFANMLGGFRQFGEQFINDITSSSQQNRECLFKQYQQSQNPNEKSQEKKEQKSSGESSDDVEVLVNDTNKKLNLSENKNN